MNNAEQLPETTRHALRIVHRVIITARTLAGDGYTQQQMFDVLDSTEYLIAVMINKTDWIINFRYALEGLALKSPKFAGLLEEFNKNVQQ